MKTNIKNSTQKKWALPGETLTFSEFKKGIVKAEKGHFYSVEESKKMLLEWRKKRNSK
jgi:hypothetical protein